MKKLGIALLLVLLLAAQTAFAEAPTLDRAGNPIAPPQEPTAIVSLAPSITRVLVDLGLADKIVAVDLYATGIEGLPEGIPALDALSPDAETLLALAPDLVIASGMTAVVGDTPLRQLADLGICVAYIPSSESIAASLDDVRFIGQLVGEAEAAEALIAPLLADIEALRVAAETPVPVYFEIDFPYTFGSGTFLNEMIELLGGRNIFADQTSWISVSEEAIIAAAPEIIFTNASWAEDPAGAILSRPGWETIPAVQNGRVYVIDSDASSQPNHHIVEALEAMVAAFE
jgi:iron complex transport system substrate-binding protein